MLEISNLFHKDFKIIAINRSALFSSKCTANCLAAGLRPDPLGELTALPRPPSWIKGLGAPARGGEEEEREREVSGEGMGEEKGRRGGGKGRRREGKGRGVAGAFVQ